MNELSVAVVLFAVICLFGIKPRKEFDISAALEKEQTIPLRGILCLLIILHHLSLAVDAGGVFGMFKYVGVVAVGAFFFLSGYGIMKQSEKQGEVYLKGFLRKRVLKLIVPLAVAFVVSFCAFWLLGIKSPSEIFSSFLKFDPFPYHSWYIWAVMLLYICFWLSKKLIKNQKAVLAALTVLSLVIMLVFVFVGRVDNFASSVFCFPFGSALARYEKSLKKCLNARKKRIVTVVFTALILSALIVCHNFLPDTFPYLKHILRNIINIGFCFVIVLFASYIKFGNGLLNIIGVYSFEIYLWHGTVYKLLRQIGFLTANSLVFVLVASVCCVVFGICMGYIAKLPAKLKSNKNRRADR